MYQHTKKTDVNKTETKSVSKSLNLMMKIKLNYLLSQQTSSIYSFIHFLPIFERFSKFPLFFPAFEQIEMRGLFMKVNRM